MGNKKKNNKISVSTREVKELYQIYTQVQSGNKDVLNKLFKQKESKHICRYEEMSMKYRMSHMDNILDSDAVLDNEKSREEREWMNSSYSNVTFQLSCLNKLLYNKKKYYLSKAKNTGYENGEKVKSSGNRKYYEGEYDISDLNELVYETVIEIFYTPTDENNCLTLDGKKNEKYPICDGISLLRNISYFTSRKINKRAKNCYLDLYDTAYCSEEDQTNPSNFDQYAFEKFLKKNGGTSRLTIYAECLKLIERNDIHKLFKVTSGNLKAIIETIMTCEDTFIPYATDDLETGLGMRFVTQETLRKIIKSRHNMNIKQENISKDMEIIEQRFIDHLFCSLNYRIDKAEESKGIYKKESERFLYELDEKKYIKMFSRAGYEIYDRSIHFSNSRRNGADFDSYFRTIKKYEDMVIDIVLSEKGKKKYDMFNLIMEEDDLVDNKNETLLYIADTIIMQYQKKEEEYRESNLGEYKIKGITDWEKGYWEADLKIETLNIRLFSDRNVKNPVRYHINRKNLMVYCGYMNFYICNMEDKICFVLPKMRRIISKSNKKHEIFIYRVR